MSRLISLIALLACIVIIGILFYKVMIGFLIPLFLAAVLVVLFRPLHRRVLVLCNNKHHFAAAITTTIVACLVLIPAGLAGTFAAIQGISIARNINTNSIKVGMNKFQDTFELHAPEMDRIRSIDGAVDKIQAEINSKSIQELANGKGMLGDYEKSVRDNIVGLTNDYLNSVKSESLKDIKKFEETDLDPIEREKYKSSINKAIADKEVEIKKYLDSRPTSPTTEPVSTEGNANTETQSTYQLPKNLNGVEHVGDQDVLVSIQELLVKLDRATPSDDPNDPGYNIDIVTLQNRALELNTTWQTLRTSLLGGTVLGFFREVTHPTDAQIKEYFDWTAKSLRPALVDFTGQTGSFLVRLTIGTGIMMVALFFFLYDGPAMIRALMKLSPLDDQYEMELLNEFDRIVRAIVLALISSAIFQGFTAGIGYYFAGMHGLVFLTILTTLCALIPFVGPAIVWVPVCIYLSVYEGRYVAAGGLAIWGFIAVGSIDNVVKTFVLHGQSSLHPLFALLSILGGVQALGPIGIVVGPIVVTLLQTLLKILNQELSEIDKPMNSPAMATAVVEGQGPIAGAEKGGFPSMIDRLRMRAAEFRAREKKLDPDDPTGGLGNSAN